MNTHMPKNDSPLQVERPNLWVIRFSMILKTLNWLVKKRFHCHAESHSISLVFQASNQNCFVCTKMATLVTKTRSLLPICSLFFDIALHVNVTANIISHIKCVHEDNQVTIESQSSLLSRCGKESSNNYARKKHWNIKHH